jgi:hypothetical protein
MTFDEFKEDFLKFLENSTVNLGRKTAKTRQAFIDKAVAKFETFVSSATTEKDSKGPSKSNPMSDSVMCIKPPDGRKGLNIGKGVHAMTSPESARADEQLGRSPYGQNKDG